MTTYTYDLAGNLIKATLPNGTTETREYDLLNRLLYLQNSNSSGVFNSFRYTLDKVGNRLTVTEQDGSSTPLTTSRKVNYDYDALYRLLKEEIIDGTTRTISYTYDAVSNRLTRNDSAEGNTTYEYDNNDRLLKEVSNGVATTYTYDNNGNTLSKRTGTDKTTYQWDAENRLVGVDSNGDGVNEVTNKYDSEGIRVGQTVNGEETRFLVDRNRDYAQVLEEYTPSKIIKASYVYGHDLISQLRNNQRSFYHVDGLGSTRALTDINGLVTDAYAYEAFGEIIKQLGNTQNLYLFAGEQRDPNIGLDYLRARYLDINSGRFISRDSFNGYQNLPISLNKYIYANANSVSNIDPSGNITLAQINIFFTVLDILTFIASPTPLNFASIVAGRLAPAKYVKGLEKIVGSQLAGKLSLLGHNLSTTASEFTEYLVRNLLQSKYGARVFLGDEGLRVINHYVLNQGGRRVDFVGDIPNGKLVFGEAKSSPSYQTIEESIEKFQNSIDTLKRVYAQGGNIYPGTEKLVIGLSSLGNLNSFRPVGNAVFSVQNGILMRGGGPVIVDGQKIFVEIL